MTVKQDNVSRLKKEDFESTGYKIGELIYGLETNCVNRGKIGKAIFSNSNLIYNSEEEIEEYPTTYYYSGSSPQSLEYQQTLSGSIKGSTSSEGYDI